MRVLYVSKALIVAAYRDKLRALAAHADVTAVVPRRWGGEPVEASDVDGLPIAFWNVVLDGHNHFHLYRAAARMVREAAADFVHIDEEPYSAVTAQLVRQCGRQGVPCCFFAAQNLDRPLPAPFRRMRRHVFRGVAGGLAGTDTAARLLRRWGFAGRVAVIPQLGVNAERFRPCAQARARQRDGIRAGNAFVVGYAGRFVPEKGLPLLVRAFASLRDDARLVLIGDGPERSAIDAAARAAGVHERVHVVGRVGSTAMPDWLNALDVLVLPSVRLRNRMEQFGRILVEAMACGVPVVGTTCGEIPRVIGNAGIVVTERREAELAAALAALEGDAVERARLGGLGRRRVLEHFTNDSIAERTVRFYRRALEAA
ncbi:MAG: glycosyltransferase family 4 protein [Gemmatimonadetes bacterium]|nr:glycosyltransferase family 4 protein [Gemmatimonadota bacterium]